MPNSLPPITEWKRIFIDTSFIIDCITDAEKMTNGTRKLDCANARKLVDSLENYSQDVTWMTSSIVLSELTKFENEDLVGELQSLLNSAEVEIINFTRREAKFIVNDMVDYVEEKHINQYLKRRKK